MTLFTDSIFLTNEVEGFKTCRETRSEKSVNAILCLKGYIELDMFGKMVHVGEGDIFVRVPHQGFTVGPYNYSEDYQFLQLTVDAKIFEQLMLDHMRVEPRWWQKLEYMKANPVFHLNEVSQDFCKAYFRLFELQLRSPQSDYRKQILMALARAVSMELLNYLDKILPVPDDDSARASVNHSDYTFHEFTRLLQLYPHQREVQWYASKLNITPKYLSEICKERSGKSASEWIADITVSELTHRLQNTTLPIREIAELMEFPNASFFCQYTKKHTGLTPNKLRKQKKN